MREVAQMAASFYTQRARRHTAFRLYIRVLPCMYCPCTYILHDESSTSVLFTCQFLTVISTVISRFPCCQKMTAALTHVTALQLRLQRFSPVLPWQNSPPWAAEGDGRRHRLCKTILVALTGDSRARPRRGGRSWGGSRTARCCGSGRRSAAGAGTQK